ncbi:glycosyltransferase [bacterium 210820-DFI.6.37]|nr:glycosyltransferase [bacterium 210820-DFI.6.37]
MVDGLVSVIMPSWNTGKFIAESIQSVIDQTYKTWELLIVDDCSTDNTDEIVASFHDERIKYFKNKKNCGAALARNKAMREAQGEWIAFLDSDDLWMPEKLEKQIGFMNEKNCVFSYHDFMKIDEESKPLHVYVTGPNIVTKKKMYNYGYPGCLTFMYNAKAMGLIQIKDIKKNNDYAILLKLCKKADCYLLKENLAQYRIRKKSISHDKFSKKLKSHYDLFHYCDEKLAPIALWYACWNMVYGVMKKRKYEKTKEICKQENVS